MSGEVRGRTASRAVAAVRPTREVLRDVEDPSRLLTPAEQNRAASFRYDGDRDDFVAAHVLVRLCAAELVGGSPQDITVVQTCTACGGAHGKPALVGHEGVHVSWSHAAGAVAAFAAHVPCGIDLEPRADDVDPGLADVALTERERKAVEASREPGTAFLRLWLRKEAIVKAGAVELDSVFSLDVTDAAGGVLTPRTASGAAVRSWAITEYRSATHLATVLTGEDVDVSLYGVAQKR